MTWFELIKQVVQVPEAAAYYGLQVSRNGMACCPFHDDRHPSMKLNERYFYCFGCGATGDVIDLVAKLFDLSSYEAAKSWLMTLALTRTSHQRQSPCLNRNVRC